MKVIKVGDLVLRPHDRKIGVVVRVRIGLNGVSNYAKVCWDVLGSKYGTFWSPFKRLEILSAP